MPHWALWLLLAFFLGSLTITIRSLRRRRRVYGHYSDPFAGWDHHDGRDAADVATDPGIPAVDFKPPSPDTWAMDMETPAPAITAEVISVEQAEAWAQKWREQELARA